MSAALNILLVLIMAALTFGGMRRGLRRELINLVGVAVALAGGVLLARPVSALFAQLGVLEDVPWLVAFLGGFVVSSLIFSIIKTPFLPKEVDLAERVSGALVGFLKGMVAAALFVYLLSGVWPPAAEELGEAPAARFVMPITRVVDTAVGGLGILLPDDLQERFRRAHHDLRNAVEGVEEMLDTLEGAGETVREYADKVGEGAAVVDSLAHSVVPPPGR